MDQPPFAAFAAFLAKLKEERGVLQSDIARAVDVAPSQTSGWSNGRSRPKPGNLERMAEAFALDLDVLLKLCGYPTGTQPASDPDENELLAIYRLVPSEHRDTVKHMLRGLAVQPVNRGLANRPRDEAGNRRTGGRPQLDQHGPSIDEQDAHGQIPTCFETVKPWAARVYECLNRLVGVPTRLGLPEPAR